MSREEIFNVVAAAFISDDCIHAIEKFYDDNNCGPSDEELYDIVLDVFPYEQMKNMTEDDFPVAEKILWSLIDVYFNNFTR